MYEISKQLLPGSLKFDWRFIQGVGSEGESYHSGRYVRPDLNFIPVSNTAKCPFQHLLWIRKIAWDVSCTYARRHMAAQNIRT